MCFCTEDIKSKTAKHDIKCYKVVKRVYEPQKCYGAPFYTFRFMPNTLYKAFNFLMDLTNTLKYKDGMQLGITEGGFYSFKSIEGAQKLKEKIHSFYPCTRLMVVECVIPKGALYYTSCLDSHIAYCSDKIKIVARFSRGKRISEEY